MDVSLSYFNSFFSSDILEILSTLNFKSLYLPNEYDIIELGPRGLSFRPQLYQLCGNDSLLIARISKFYWGHPLTKLSGT